MKNLGGDFLETLGAPLYNDVLNAFFQGGPWKFRTWKRGGLWKFWEKKWVVFENFRRPPPFFWGGS